MQCSPWKTWASTEGRVRPSSFAKPKNIPGLRDRLLGWCLALGSHAPALCLFQLQPGENGGAKAHSWVVRPTWSHTLAVCALHLIAVALSWGARILCAILTATISSSKEEAGTVYRAISSSERHAAQLAPPAHRRWLHSSEKDVIKVFYEFVKDH